MILGSVPADYDPTKALDIDALQPSELQAELFADFSGRDREAFGQACDFSKRA
jgi:hypothetical protein